MIDKNKTREAIEKASVAYSGNSYDYQEGFKAGINWFLKNLWHPMSDKPEMGSEILVLRDMEVYRKNHFGIDVNKSFVHEFDFHDNWDNYADDSEYKGWLYIENLMNDGKLNLETLEIEKPEPRFKEGDILVREESLNTSNAKCILIFKTDRNAEIMCYAFYNDYSRKLYINQSVDTGKIRLATDSEKQQLFDALAKEGKRWNAETKTLEDLPRHKRPIWRYRKKCEFKAFDRVLVRDTPDEMWMPNFFSNYGRDTDEFKYGCIAGNSDSVIYSKYCIPYNDQTAHLLDTTDDYEE